VAVGSDPATWVRGPSWSSRVVLYWARYLLPGIGPLAVGAVWSSIHHLRSPLAVHWTWQGMPNGYLSLTVFVATSAGLYAACWLYVLVFGRSAMGAALGRHPLSVTSLVTGYAVLTFLTAADILILALNAGTPPSHNATALLLLVPLPSGAVGALCGWFLARAARLTRDTAASRR
jgi:hypothetical protein